MNSFKSKFPAITALLLISAAFAQDFAAQGETVLQKLEGSVAIVPQVLAFVPQASQLGAEASALKASPTDIEAGVEVLVTDLAFSSTKAQAIIAAVFPLAESLAGLVPQAQALVAAIKS